MSTRRKLAIATWSSPREGNIYGKLTVGATEALRYIEELRQRTGEKVTITHLVGKAVGIGLAQSPGLNGYIRFGSYIPHDRVDLSFLVAFEDGGNLAKAKVCDIDKKPLADIARELREMSGKLHEGKDEQFKRSQNPVKLLPMFLLRQVVRATGFLTSSLGVSVPAFGLEAFPFGSCIITSVGMLGLDEGYVPPTPFARVPLYVLVGALRDAPVVDNGKLGVGKELTLTATLDHRFVDGVQISVLARTIRGILENPWQLDGLQRPSETRADEPLPKAAGVPPA
jgi:pyruvate dehydrogenase E2 component (dihydrolipoamide acetyltransferase)